MASIWWDPKIVQDLRTQFDPVSDSVLIISRFEYLNILLPNILLLNTECMDWVYIMWVKSSANGNYLKKWTTESKEKKILVKGKLDPDAIFGMADFFCLGNTISNSLYKGGKRLKALKYNKVLHLSVKTLNSFG